MELPQGGFAYRIVHTSSTYVASSMTVQAFLSIEPQCGFDEATGYWGLEHPQLYPTPFVRYVQTDKNWVTPGAIIIHIAADVL